MWAPARMMRACLLAIVIGVMIILAVFLITSPEPSSSTVFGATEGDQVHLPPALSESGGSVEKALSQRRSVRAYASRPINISDISQILWACQGISGPGGFRTAPSAGALYPLEVYLVASGVEGLQGGIYHYLPVPHTLQVVRAGDFREDLFHSALDQTAVRDPPAVLVITGVYEKRTVKYGERGVRYVHMEAGHAAENVYLQATSLGMGTVAIGAFHDEEVRRILLIEDGETPLYLMPVGYLF